MSKPDLYDAHAIFKEAREIAERVIPSTREVIMSEAERERYVGYATSTIALEIQRIRKEERAK
jgi:hypothetical protein